jgi:hypothetical protein
VGPRQTRVSGGDIEARQTHASGGTREDEFFPPSKLFMSRNLLHTIRGQYRGQGTWPRRLMISAVGSGT